jgi:protein-tyrosine-phosphatase
MSPLFSELQRYIQQRESEASFIPPLRRSSLSVVGERVFDGLGRTGAASLMFVCTHNARRSQLSQVWSCIAAHHFELAGVRAFSAGSSPTRVHPRILGALAQAGVEIQASTVDGRPVHEARFAPTADALHLFSKRYDDPSQPQTGFIAIVNCPSADEGCPVIPGSIHRLAILYADPGAADGTPDEERTYAKRCAEIARDMLFLFGQVRASLDKRVEMVRQATGR